MVLRVESSPTRFGPGPQITIPARGFLKGRNERPERRTHSITGHIRLEGFLHRGRQPEKNHRFPPQIIAHAVWLYFRFPLSLRWVEEMLLERSIVVSCETIRRWGRQFGAANAQRLRRKKPSPEDIWHLDEMVMSIGGRKHWLWRAVAQAGYVLDEIVQARRDTKSAKRLLVRLLKKQGLKPKRIVTDQLRSYSAARRAVMPAVEQRSHKGLNNRAENSHLPLRKREPACSSTQPS